MELQAVVVVTVVVVIGMVVVVGVAVSHILCFIGEGNPKNLLTLTTKSNILM